MQKVADMMCYTDGLYTTVGCHLGFVVQCC